MSDLPAVDTVWEWDLDTQHGLVVVRVMSTDPDTMSVVLDGAAPFPQTVTLEDFLSHAVPPRLRGR
jgi:hypothetical protein